MKASGADLVAQVERGTPEPGEDCVLEELDYTGLDRHETPEVEQTWLPEGVPPLPAMVWCWSHRRWELKPKEGNEGE